MSTGIKLWDMSGSRKYKWIVSRYVKSADVVLFVCDVNSVESIENINNYWYDYVLYSDRNKKTYVVVNKIDSENFDKKIISDINNFFEKEIGVRKIFYVSALKNIGIEEMFSDILLDRLRVKNKIKHKNRRKKEKNVLPDYDRVYYVMI